MSSAFTEHYAAWAVEFAEDLRRRQRWEELCKRRSLERAQQKLLERRRNVPKEVVVQNPEYARSVRSVRSVRGINRAVDDARVARSVSRAADDECQECCRACSNVLTECTCTPAAYLCEPLHAPIDYRPSGSAGGGLNDRLEAAHGLVDLSRGPHHWGLLHARAVAARLNLAEANVRPLTFDTVPGAVPSSRQRLYYVITDSRGFTEAVCVSDYTMPNDVRHLVYRGVHELNVFLSNVFGYWSKSHSFLLRDRIVSK